MKIIPLISALSILMFLSSCKKDYNYIYDVGSEAIYSSNAEKTKQKSSTQFISILYSNLFQTSISQQELNDLTELRMSIGDKQIADDLVISAYINDGSVQIPSDADMRANIEQFVEDTYLRFYLRKPTPYEARYLKESIESDSDLSPDLIYTAFAESNEYKFY
jgi:hypothetical protein